MSGFSGLGFTLWPEWVWAIHALPGPLAKRAENRIWPPPKMYVGPWHAMHAGKLIGGREGIWAIGEAVAGLNAMGRRAGWRTHYDWDSAGRKWSISFNEDNGPVTWAHSRNHRNAGCGVLATPIVTSAITGVFRIRSVLLPGEESAEDGIRGWKLTEAYGWIIDYRPLATPIPCSGAQKFWSIRDRMSLTPGRRPNLIGTDGGQPVSPEIIDQHLATLAALAA